MKAKINDLDEQHKADLEKTRQESEREKEVKVKPNNNKWFMFPTKKPSV